MRDLDLVVRTDQGPRGVSVYSANVRTSVFTMWVCMCGAMRRQLAVMVMDGTMVQLIDV